MNLSIKQQDAINHVDGPALILAVPGAGKTTVLVHRTHNLIKNHRVSPERILSITFSKASAIDMKRRFDLTFPNPSYNKVHFSTIHAFCYGFIREYAYIDKIKYGLIEGVKGPINKHTLLKQIYLNVNKEYITEEKLESLINAIGYIKNMMISPEDFLKKNRINMENFDLIYGQYERYKKERNLLDFDDMLVISREILESNKYLLEKYRAKYDYIQVDEGQDTSKIQMEIINLIARPKENLFIVADDDQSIYGFRGAYPKALLNFENNYKSPKIFFMEENYRSSKEIVYTCNEFIKSNRERYKKNIFTANPYIQPINLIKVKSISHQYKYIIEDLKSKDLSNTCILYRNNLSSIGIIESLERHNIAFHTRDKKLRFFNHWLLKEVLDFMAFAQDTSNMALYENLYYKIKGYISKKQINYAKTLNSSLSVFDRILDFPGINNFYKNTLRELKLDFKKISKLSPSLAIDYIENNLEYGEYLKDSAIRFGYTYDSLNTILYFLKTIAEKTSDLEGFKERLGHIMNLCSNSPNTRNALTLSTVHSAKGLEFENVYMIDLIDGEFPNSTSIDDYQRNIFQPLEEERRLFYVGMSRAKTNLTLVTYNNIKGQGLLPSRFLKELDENI